MMAKVLLEEPGRVDEPMVVQGYADVLSEVAIAGRPLVVRRNGEDLVAVIPLEQIGAVRDSGTPGGREPGRAT